MIEEKTNCPRLLTITVNAWSDTISSGNTISNHFGGWDPKKIANIFLRSEQIDNKCCSKYFRMTERDILKSMLSGKSLGIEISYDKKNNTIVEVQNKIKKNFKIIESVKRIRPTSILLLREIYWAVGFRRKDKLNTFLKNFDPEVIHMHCPGLIYAHRVLHYCQKVTNAKVVLFCGDEIYSYKNFWPLERLYHFILRGWIKKTINISNLNYAATPELCEYYSRIFDKDFKVLYKGALLVKPTTKPHKLPLKIVYAGNILFDRWRTLSLICKAIKDLSRDNQLFKLEIYTHNALSKKMLSALNNEYSEVKGAVPYKEVRGILSDADIILHVESFTKKYTKITKFSFSTKIIDCIQTGSCVMAVGPDKLASINFLKQTNAAIIANNYEEIRTQLKRISSDTKIIDDLPVRMNDFAKDKFDLNKIRKKIYGDVMKMGFDQ